MAGSELWMALALATYPLLVSFKKVSLVCFGELCVFSHGEELPC